MTLPSNLFKLLVTAVVLGGAVSSAFAQDFSGPVLGDVGTDHARLWIKTPQASKVQWMVSTNETLVKAIESPTVSLQAAEHFNGTLKIEGLTPDTKYFYNVTINGKAIFEKPLPSFTTSRPLNSAGHLRFAFSSCLGLKATDSDRAWKDMAARPFDLLVLLGDQHYANSTDTQVLLDHYVAYRANDNFRSIARQKPVYTIWDDHDYGGNDVDGSLPGKERSLAVFKEVWPNPSFGEADNPGVYYSFVKGDVEFFMLDGRYYRSADEAKDEGTKTNLGERQLAWLKQSLKFSQAKLKIIANGVEFNGNHKSDSWFYFQREREDILKFIADNKIEGVFFISGDSHYTASFQMKEGFLEITSGPLGSSHVSMPENPYILEGFDQGQYYSIVDIDTTLPEPKITWEVYGFLPKGETMQSKCVWDWVAVLGQKPAECINK